MWTIFEAFTEFVKRLLLWFMVGWLFVLAARHVGS